MCDDQADMTPSEYNKKRDQEVARDSIVTGFVGQLGNTVSVMCQNLEVAASDPEAKELIKRVLTIQTEIMLMKMEGADPDDVEMVEGALISASQSLKAAGGIDTLKIVKKAWKSHLLETMTLILKLA